MDNDDTTYDSSSNLMHLTNEKKGIEENAKGNQHNPDFENADEGDNEEHLVAPHRTIIAVNVTKKNSFICQNKNVLEDHTRSWTHCLFSPFDRNCPEQRKTLNRCYQVDLQTLERGQEIYTDCRGTDVIQILLIGQLMWIFNPRREEK